MHGISVVRIGKFYKCEYTDEPLLDIIFLKFGS